MSYQTYQQELTNLRSLDRVASSKELNNEIDALTNILFAGPESKEESYYKTITHLMNKIKIYQLSSIDNVRTLCVNSEQKAKFLNAHREKLLKEKESFSVMINLLNEIISARCQPGF